MKADEKYNNLGGDLGLYQFYAEVSNYRSIIGGTGASQSLIRLSSQIL